MEAKRREVCISIHTHASKKFFKKTKMVDYQAFLHYNKNEERFAISKPCIHLDIVYFCEKEKDATRYAGSGSRREEKHPLKYRIVCSAVCCSHVIMGRDAKVHAALKWRVYYDETESDRAKSAQAGHPLETVAGLPVRRGCIGDDLCAHLACHHLQLSDMVRAGGAHSR